MALRRFAVGNYRSFRDRQELEVFPVTVVLGKNNSGKSALVRAPLLLATGFTRTSTAPFDLEALGEESVDAFTDLIFEQNAHGRIRVEVETGGRLPFTMAATIQHIDETSDVLIRDLTVTLSPEEELRLTWDQDSTGRPHTYRAEENGKAYDRAVTFAGLVPQLEPWQELPGLGPMRYLSAYRQRPARQHRLPVGLPKDLGVQGEGLPALLAHDKVRGGGVLIDTVNRHLREIVPDWRLDEVAMGPLYATVLRRDSNPELKVNLADAGAGLAQVLPILVRCALDELAGVESGPDDRPRQALQIIEEPEMHLHPGAHAALADLYLRTARTTGTRFLIETHSETLLLRLRRRIAEGEYPADMVGIYIVEQVDGVSTVRRVELDELGNLGEGWPDGYFSQDYHEVRALASAQRRRSGDAS